MKPRIFVSSTFYDLKYIREDLANFIKAHDFEPILFEDGDIGYTPFNNLDDSCYKAMETADMAILIVGGNYGSPASGESPSDFDEFISITRREFQKGVENGIPFFVFIDRNVYAEFGIYDLNSKEIDSGEYKITFRSTKNINVFRFIREIQSIKQISIIEFDKSVDIKDFLSKQWADMFKTYLSSLKEQKEIELIHDSINHMNVLIEKMDRILDAVGKEVLKNSTDEYQQLIIETEKAEAKAICLRLAKFIRVDVDKNINKKRRDQVMSFLTALTDLYERQEQFLAERSITSEGMDLDDANLLIKPFVEALKEAGMRIRDLKLDIFYENTTIYPFLKDPDKTKEVYALLCSGPYYYRIFKIINAKTTEDAPISCDE